MVHANRFFLVVGIDYKKAVFAWLPIFVMLLAGRRGTAMRLSVRGPISRSRGSEGPAIRQHTIVTSLPGAYRDFAARCLAGSTLGSPYSSGSTANLPEGPPIHEPGFQHTFRVALAELLRLLLGKDGDGLRVEQGLEFLRSGAFEDLLVFVPELVEGDLTRGCLGLGEVHASVPVAVARLRVRDVERLLALGGDSRSSHPLVGPPCCSVLAVLNLLEVHRLHED